MSRKDIISLNHVYKEFDTPNGVFKVIEDLDIKVKENEFLVLFGPGQCGKTTILNLIAGFEPVTSGSITVNGEKCNQTGARSWYGFPDHSIISMVTCNRKCRVWSKDAWGSS